MKDLVSFSLASLLGLALFALALPSLSHAQTVTRRDVPKGDVTGLEMAVEGSMNATPGGQLRWFVTVYEIVKGRELRPASGVDLRVLASFHPQDPVVSVKTDARGRASLQFAVPKTLEDDFALVVEARSPKGVKRNFDVQVNLAQRYRTELFVERRNLPPGAELRVWGRVFDLANMRPAPKHTLQVHARVNHRLVGKRHELKTNAEGGFEVLLRAPTKQGAFTVDARAEDAGNVVQQVHALITTPPALIVRAEPTVLVTEAGKTIDVDVVVRTPDGRPVAKAALTGLSIPVAKEGEKAKPPVLTDAHGRARVPWLVRGKGEVAQISGQIQALREGIGTGNGVVSVRMSRVPVLVSWAVEGGALIPGLPNQIIVRALHPDGSPWPNLPLRLEGGRIQASPVQTDATGMASFESSLAARDTNAPASCYGPTVAAATLTLAGGTRSLCLPVDPDATLRVRSASRVRAGSTLELSLLASPTVARAPVAITLLARRKGKDWVPLAQQVVKASQKTLRLPIPSEARGALWIRAGPLVGRRLQPVRGGTAMVWAQAGDPSHLQLTPAASGAMKLRTQGGTGASRSGFAIALPTEEGHNLLRELRVAHGNRPDFGAGETEWAGFLAAQTPSDRAVSSVLRNGKAMALAMPEDSVAMGLLRDPWRTRARFVRGRLGRLMFAVERHVDESLPRSLDNVAVRGPRGWRFNSEILTVMANEMGIDAVAGLDGDPLSIADLQALDSDFAYDKVASRLTRKRLLAVLVALRHFVAAENLDYQWARRGDPKTWLRSLLDWDDPDGETYMEMDQLYDGWGKPLAIRKAKGGRARFRFLEPIVGYEVVSAGPDGRFGNGDDLFDPFARVLRKNSLYGEAIGEEALLARLKGVELGRATIAALREAFEVEPMEWIPSEATANDASWQRVPKLHRPEDAMSAETTRASLRSSSGFASLSGVETKLPLRLSADPKRYLVVAGLYTSDGSSAFDAHSLRAGAPLLIEARLPPRLRPNEPLRVPVHLIGLDRAQELTLRVSGSGAVRATLAGPKKIRLQAGESKTLSLEISASRVGQGSIHLRFEAADGSTIRELKHELSVLWDGTMKAQHSGAFAINKSKLSLSLPADALPVRSMLVVSAPRDLLRDPGFAKVKERYPELLAWAHAMHGEEVPKELLAALSREEPGHRSMPTLVVANAALAWSATEETPKLRVRRNRAIGALRRQSDPTSLRERSAVLVALASGSSSLGDSKSSDPVTAMVSRLRADGWHAPRTEKSRPTIMARLAAGLLLADSEDMPARQLFKLARASLVPSDLGGQTLPATKGNESDAWIGTLALAIAARQLGEEELLSELVGSIGPRMYLGMQGRVEPAFWLLAASAYGVFGVDRPKNLRATVNGKLHVLKVVKGVAEIALPSKKAEVLIESSGPVLARVEARYMRPIKATASSPLSAKVQGEVGHSGDTAALELKLRNGGKWTAVRPVVELVLPSAAFLSSDALAAIAGAPGVARVEEPDRAGLLRIHFSRLESKQERRVSLPLHWIGEGKVSGLGLSVYDAQSPWLISSTPGRTIQLKPAPLEKWK